MNNQTYNHSSQELGHKQDLTRLMDYVSATGNFHPEPKEGRENWESLTVNINSIFHLTVCFLEDILSFIDLWNLRNSVRSVFCDTGSYKLWNSAYSSQKNISQFILNPSWISEHTENILSLCLSLCKAEEICRPETASQFPTPNWRTSPELTISCMCRVWVEGAVRTGILTRCSLLLVGWLK